MSPWSARTGALGFAVGVALGLLWRVPADPSNASHPLIKPEKAPDPLQRHLATVKSNAALSAILRSALVTGKLEEEVAGQAPQPRAAVFCVVYTVRGEYPDFDLLVNDSWGRHCDHLLFVSTDPEAVRPGLTTFVDEPTLLGASHRVLRHLHRQSSAVAAWVLWASVNSFVVVENLRHLAAYVNYSEPTYLGPMWPGAHRSRPGSNNSFALNWAALDRIARSNCSSFKTMSRCAYSAGVKVVDSRDERGCARFFDGHLEAGLLPFRNAFTRWPVEQCVSPTFVLVRVSSMDMLLFEYLTHVLAAYGLRRHDVSDAHARWDAAPTWSPEELRLIKDAASSASKRATKRH